MDGCNLKLASYSQAHSRGASTQYAVVTLPEFDYTAEPPNKGRVGTRSFVLYREVPFIRRLKCTGIIGIGTSRFVLYREVFFIWSVLYRRFHCI